MLRYLAAFVLASCGLVTGIQAQEWSPGRVPEMLVSELSPTGAMASGQWFISDAAMRPETVGLGIIYVHVPGSAGTVSIHAGLFLWSGSGWYKTLPVSGLYGFSPQEARFHPVHMELVTLTPGPEDARCCPSVRTRWSINLRSGTARVLD